jgi:translation elongation factor EF-1alpha
MKGDNMMERSASMEWYGGPPVIRLLEDMAREQAAGRLVPMPGRMFIQDVYPDDGKEMLVGKVETGLFRAGDKVKLWPPGTERRIEAIHGPGGKMLDSAAAGQNIGLTLDGGGGIARGAVCMGGDAPGPAGAFRARIFCLPEGSIEAGAELFLGRASESVGCSVKEIEKRTDPVRGKTESGGSRVGPCESADVLIETARPMVFERFSDVPPMGRFVLSKGGRIAAVGVVL